MYESPINLTYSEPIYEEVTNHLNETIYQAVASVGVDVDRNELVKALAYDRNQYEKGYADCKREYAWRPVSEKPKEDGKYFVLVECGGDLDTDILYWNSSHGWHIFYQDIVYWMPTPEKPKYEP